MGRILVNDSGKLSLTFEFAGRTWEEPTAFPATESNAKRVRRLLDRIEGEVRDGTFDHELSLPASMHAPTVVPPSNQVQATTPPMPTLEEFGRRWFEQMRVGWKPSNCESIAYVLEGAVYPKLGSWPIDTVRRGDLLAFRAETMRTRAGRNGNATIGNRRANRIMTVLRGRAAARLRRPVPAVRSTDCLGPTSTSSVG